MNRARYVAGLALCVGLALPAVALAQNEAKEHYQQGVALFEAGNYKAALAEFLVSYEAKPNWKLKHTIGVCYFNLNRFVEAQKALDGYLEEGADQVPADKKTEAEDMLEQISKLIASIEVDANVEGATVWIDDEKVATTPMAKPIILDSGVYTMEITAPGYVKYKKDLKLAGGDKKVFDIALEKQGTDTGTVTPPVDGGGEGDGNGGEGDKGKGKDKDKDKGKGKDKDKDKVAKAKKPKTAKTKAEKQQAGLLGGAIAGGVLMLGGGVAIIPMGITVNNKANDFNECAPTTSPPCQQIKSDGESLRTITNIMIIPAAVGAAAFAGCLAGYFVVKNKAKKSAEKQPEAEPEKEAFIPMIAPVITNDTVMIGMSGTF